MTKKTPADTYDPDRAWRIFDQLKEGKSYAELAAMADMPDMDTLEKWLHTEPHFLRLVRLARGCQAQDNINEIKNIADNVSIDNPAAVEKARLQCEVRMWMAEQLYPLLYASRK